MTTTQAASTPLLLFLGSDTMISITPPLGWAVDVTRIIDVPLILVDPQTPAGKFRPNINLVVQSLGNLSREEYLTLTRLQLKGAAGTVRVERDCASQKVQGGHIFEFESKFDEQRMRCRQLVLFQDNLALIFTATTELTQFAEYTAMLEAALDSVKVPMKSEAK